MKKFKVGAIVILIFLIIALGALYILSKKNDNENCDKQSETCKVDLSTITTPIATETQVGSFGSPQKINQNIYKNEKLGFQLTFDSIWQDAKVTETIPSANAEGKIEFQLKTSDPSFKTGYATALTIYVYKTENNPDPADEPMLTKITDNGTYVYQYVGWQKVPSDLGQITEKEISRIASSLKVTN